MHLVFFVSMCFIDTDIESPLEEGTQDSKREMKEDELAAFHMLKWGHLLTFAA